MSISRRYIRSARTGTEQAEQGTALPTMLGNYKVDVVQEAGHALVEGLAGGFGGGAGFEAGEVGKVLGGAEAAERREDVVGEVVEEAEAGTDDVARVIAVLGEAGEVGVEFGGDDAALDRAAEGGDDLEPFGDVEAGFVEAAIRSLN